MFKVRAAVGVAAAALVLTGLSSAVATPAFAEPHPDHEPRYEATANLDGRTTPTPSVDLSTGFEVTNHVREGQMVRIICQASGDLIYGSKIWDLVPGRDGPRFVPDHFMKTGTDGFAPEIRRCTKKETGR